MVVINEVHGEPTDKTQQFLIVISPVGAETDPVIGAQRRQ